MTIIKSQYNILLVEDKADQRELFTIVLERMGHKVFAAKNACEGLRLHASHSEIKIVFADLNLPGNMDGREMGLRMLQREPRTIMFAITGYADKFTLDDCLRAGFRDYFIKPLKFEDFAHAVKDAIQKVERWKQII